MLVCVAVRDGWRAGTLVGPQGRRWCDVLGADGEPRELTAGEPLADLLDEHGVAVLERAD